MPSVPTPPSATPTDSTEFRKVVEAIRSRQRFLLSSHSRPDGDSIGSQVAMAYALRALGKEVRIVNKDRAADPLMAFPGVADIEIAEQAIGDFDAAIIMECGDIGRPGVAGLDKLFVINIDHHPGNTAYGQLNWIDESAAACAELVFELIAALGVRLSREMALHVYLAILTDTGSFHYSNISPRTFDICRQALEAGVDPVFVARTVYDNNNVGRLRLFGAVLSAMELDGNGQIATLYVDHQIARNAGATYDDTEGLINLPLSVKEIRAAIFFKQVEGDDYRVSMRSKDEIDVAAIAKLFGGGGHKNAAGCSARGSIGSLRATFLSHVERAIDEEAALRQPVPAEK
jgi:phosphoesterase RecJ-like protein